LGILINEKLNFKDHVRNQEIKVSRSVRFPSKLKLKVHCQTILFYGAFSFQLWSCNMR